MNTELSRVGEMLILRARESARNDAYVSKILDIYENEVVGEKFLFRSGSERHGDKIERRWREWSSSAVCDLRGKSDLWQLVRQMIRYLVRDGEAFVHMTTVGGELKLSLIDPLSVPFDFTPASKQYSGVVGDAVINGVELDRDWNPIAYHVKEIRPSDAPTYAAARVVSKTRRIRAANIIHVFSPERHQQSRGYTRLSPVLDTARKLRRYIDANVIDATAAAQRMAFLKRMDYAHPEVGADVDDETVEAFGGIPQETAAGTIQVLPDGYDVVAYDPKSPGQNFEKLSKLLLKEIAAGVNVSYHSLANDYESMNFSTSRFGLADAREGFRAMQRKIINQALLPIFERWAKYEQLYDRTSGASEKDYAAASFVGRSWDYIDPARDVQSAAAQVELGIKTRTKVAEERGEDYEQNLIQRAREIENEKKYLGNDDEEKPNRSKPAPVAGETRRSA